MQSTARGSLARCVPAARTRAAGIFSQAASDARGASALSRTVLQSSPPWGEGQSSGRARTIVRSAAAEKAAAGFEGGAAPGPKEHLGFGFSAGGLLFPYYVGCYEALREEGLMTDTTPLAGASAGSLIAVSIASGRPMSDILLGLDEMAKDLREFGTRGRMREVLERILDDLLPENIHERCNGRVHVAVTRLLPPRAELISQFESKEDVIAALMTSCYIPWYFDQSRLGTRFRDGWYCDGGLTNFVPVPPNVERAVCCLPGKNVGMTVGIDIDIAPESEPHGWTQMISWAMEPGTEEELVMLQALGRTDTQKWIFMRNERLEAGLDDSPLGVPPQAAETKSDGGVIIPAGVKDILRSGSKRTLTTISEGLGRQQGVVQKLSIASAIQVPEGLGAVLRPKKALTKSSKGKKGKKK